MITMKEVMEKYGKSYTQVRYATETGRLQGIKVGWIWTYDADTLPEEWPETERKYTRRGEPPHERS